MTTQTDVLFSKPDLFAAKRVLAIQPHYDDNDIFAGGILAKLAAQGTELIYLTVTDDLVGVIDQSLSVEQMSEGLRDNQKQAGDIIGVKEQFWLGYPDAGKYDIHDVQRDMIRVIRQVRPDFVMTCDPWLPYEFHNDHQITGQAAATAASLYGLTRLATTPEIDREFELHPFELKGIAFYTTAHPNLTIDISDVWEKKQQAVSQYTAQFSPDDMEILQQRLTLGAAYDGQEKGMTYAESVKVMHLWQLHGFAHAWKV